MTYKVSYHHEIPQDIARIPKNIKEHIRRSIEERLLKDPYHFGAPLRKSLQGFRKLRVGDYRIIYKVKNDVITVLKIGPRKNVYEAVGSRDVDQ